MKTIGVQMHKEAVREVLLAFRSSAVDVWLLGGWGVDALQGAVSRDHHDVDLIARLEDRLHVRDAVGSIFDEIVEDSGTRLRFVRKNIHAEVIFSFVLPDGMLVSDLDADAACVYPWPPGSFPDGLNARLLGVPCRAISWEAQYVAKQGYSHFKRDSQLREKDRHDLAVIRQHLPEGSEAELARYFPGVPR